MSVEDPSTYGEKFGDIYDDWYQTCEPGLIRTLDDLAQGGRALELGIGTGRIALPLVVSGIEVHGIDSSPSMAEKLRAKPGGDRIPVKIGNFADVDVQGSFSLIFIVFNTFYGLLSQDEQVLCFQNVANHLSENGVFLIEAFVPNPQYFDRGQFVRTAKLEDDHVRLDVALNDVANQKLNVRHIIISEEGTRLYPTVIRYAWPSELDLMARLAGLRLRHRWSGWNRESFTSDSVKHISVYEKE